MLLTEIGSPAEFEFMKIWNECEWKFHTDYPKSIFMVNDNKVLFEQDYKNGFLYYSYILVGFVFESKFKLNYKEIKELIAGVLEVNDKLMLLTPMSPIILNAPMLDMNDKLWSLTPSTLLRRRDQLFN